MAADYDVVIIGGGISGLYTAWRLGNTTKLKILVLEATDRLGGRFLTCEMPGGFNADLGAMRYSPNCHPILDSLVQELGVKTTTSIQGGHKKNKFKYFFRNKYLNNVDELRQMFSISEEDLPLASAVFQLDFGACSKGFDLKVSDDGNFAKSIEPVSGCLAQDISIDQYLLQSNNVELLNLARPLFPPGKWPVSVVDAFLTNLAKNWKSVELVDRGFEKIINSLVDSFSKCANVEIKCGNKVSSIANHSGVFTVKSGRDKDIYSCKKVVYACSHTGLENIVLEGQADRQAKLKSMLNKIGMVPSFKMFLTYSRAWWEEGGVFEGHTGTDWPIQLCVAFGDAGKSDGFATIVASLAYDNLELFHNLDMEANERFQNVTGKVPDYLVPSKRLVEQVHSQLKQVLGCPDLEEEPVCAIRMFWGTESDGASSYYPKCGVDSNQLHWESLKPFHDADMYISSDTFAAWNENGVDMGWAELPLLTSERILTNHFGLEPFREGLSLQNLWPRN
ncbi:achacin-like [Watersipora subatra]|uniref:achacin-like n=1 Tax=Watersipora subatra TaxID=2589382 RepID=UPI00355C63F1